MRYKNYADQYARVFDAAARVAKDKGLHHMTRELIAKEAEVPESLVSYYLGTMKDTRFKLMTAAIDLPDLDLLREGLKQNHPVARSASAELRKAAFENLGQ
jgi:DNA-binding transcriptional regulator YbjK